MQLQMVQADIYKRLLLNRQYPLKERYCLS